MHSALEGRRAKLSEMLPTTSGKLFQTWSAALKKVLPVETVLEVGTVGLGIERLERPPHYIMAEEVRLSSLVDTC